MDMGNFEDAVESFLSWITDPDPDPECLEEAEKQLNEVLQEYARVLAQKIYESANADQRIAVYNATIHAGDLINPDVKDKN